MILLAVPYLLLAMPIAIAGSLLLAGAVYIRFFIDFICWLFRRRA